MIEELKQEKEKYTCLLERYIKQSEGEWIKQEDGTHYCSNCGHDATYTFDRTEICGVACTFCGAKMKGGAE